MIIDILDVSGLESALFAMRNPMDSWQKSNTVFTNKSLARYGVQVGEQFVLGDKDINLSKKLSTAGSEHCKHLRMIQVWLNIKAPRYWWQEFDTYSIGVSKISCSTMHKFNARPITVDDFEEDSDIPSNVITKLNEYIEQYNTTKDTQYLIKFKKLLPESYLQFRTVNINFAQLLNVYKQRAHHRLPNWKIFNQTISNIPHFLELTGLKID